MNKKVTHYYKKAKQIYKNEPTGHNFSHIKRCLKNIRRIQKQIGGDIFIIEVATLFHDIHRVVSTKNQYISPEKSINIVKEYLKEFSLSKDKLDKILYIISKHEIKTSDTLEPIELQILQDADILDSLGKRGLKRSIKYTKRNHIPIYNGKYKLDCKEYIPDINPISSTHYIYRTILPNVNNIKTEMGKRLARNKEKTLINFINKNIKKFKEKVIY